MLILILACTTNTQPASEELQAKEAEQSERNQNIQFFQEVNSQYSCCPTELYYTVSGQGAIRGEIVFWHVYEETEGFDGVGMEVLPVKGRQEDQRLVLQHIESRWGADIEGEPGWDAEEVWQRNGNQLQYDALTLVRTDIAQSARDKY